MPKFRFVSSLVKSFLRFLILAQFQDFRSYFLIERLMETDAQPLTASHINHTTLASDARVKVTDRMWRGTSADVTVQETYVTAHARTWRRAPVASLWRAMTQCIRFTHTHLHRSTVKVRSESYWSSDHSQEKVIAWYSDQLHAEHPFVTWCEHHCQLARNLLQLLMMMTKAEVRD